MAVTSWRCPRSQRAAYVRERPRAVRAREQRLPTLPRRLRERAPRTLLGARAADARSGRRAQRRSVQACPSRVRVVAAARGRAAVGIAWRLRARSLWARRGARAARRGVRAGRFAAVRARRARLSLRDRRARRRAGRRIGRGAHRGSTLRLVAGGGRPPAPARARAYGVARRIEVVAVLADDAVVRALVTVLRGGRRARGVVRAAHAAVAGSRVRGGTRGSGRHALADGLARAGIDRNTKGAREQRHDAKARRPRADGDHACAEARRAAWRSSRVSLRAGSRPRSLSRSSARPARRRRRSS